MTNWKALGFGCDVKKKLKEVGMSVFVILVRWLLEYVLKRNPGGGDGDASKKR